MSILCDADHTPTTTSQVMWDASASMPSNISALSYTTCNDNHMTSAIGTSQQRIK